LEYFEARKKDEQYSLFFGTSQRKMTMLMGILVWE
jgi:hypothetical protein